MANALLAFRNGDQGDSAQVGAMLLAEGLVNLRTTAKFCAGLSAALSKE